MMIWIDSDEICRLFWGQFAYVYCTVILCQRSHLLAVNDVTQISILNVRCTNLIHRYLNVQMLYLENTSDLNTFGHFFKGSVE